MFSFLDRPRPGRCHCARASRTLPRSRPEADCHQHAVLRHKIARARNLGEFRTYLQSRGADESPGVLPVVFVLPIDLVSLGMNMNQTF
jgi:hypothetical protein